MKLLSLLTLLAAIAAWITFAALSLPALTGHEDQENTALRTLAFAAAVAITAARRFLPNPKP